MNDEGSSRTPSAGAGDRAQWPQDGGPGNGEGLRGEQARRAELDHGAAVPPTRAIERVPATVEVVDRAPREPWDARSSRAASQTLDPTVRPRRGMADAGDEEDSGLKELVRLHYLMRGRYLLAFLLAGVLGTGGAYLGFKLGRKTFQSTGMVQVEQVEPIVIERIEDKGSLPNFQGFVAAHAAEMRSQRVIEKAMDEEPWKELRRGISPEALLRFADNLDVSASGDIIFVKAIDDDPNVAMRAVRSLIRAHRRLYDEHDRKGGTDRMEILQAEERRNRAEEARLKEEIRRIATQYGGEDLRPEHQAIQQELARLGEQIGELEQALVAAGGAAAANGPATRPSADQLTERQMAAMDPQGVGRLLQERDDLDRQRRVLEKRGYPERHPQMLMVLAQLEVANADLAEEVARFREAYARGMAAAAAAAGAGGPLMAPQVSLGERLASLKKYRDERKKRSDELLLRQFELDDLQVRLRDAQAATDQIRQRIEKLRIEENLRGRFRTISDGDMPLKPYRDTRIIFGGAGGVGGVMLGFGLVLGIALLDRRLRNSDEARLGFGENQLLGILPTMPDQLGSAEDAALAAHCVHEVRTLLQIQGRRRGAKAFVITSPNAGAGKTSLALALGISFASARLRTLMVDADLVGGGLTSRVSAAARRRLGRIVRERGLATEEQLRDALAEAKTSGRRLGDVLIERGYVSREDVEGAAASQDEEMAGLLDTLSGVPLSACVAETGIENLWVLPLGGATAQHVPVLSPESMHELLDDAKRHFDMVLIDSGPTPGSLEASLAASVADAVVVTVARGDARGAIDRCLTHLRGLGAHVAGMVFNRATLKDVHTNSSSRLWSTSRRTQQQASSSSDSDGRMGLLAMAVTTRAPRSGSGSISKQGAPEA